MFISFRRSARQLYPSGMNQKKRNHCRLFKQKAVECRALRCLMALSEDLQESGEVATYIQQFRVLGGCCSYRNWKIQGHSPPPPQCWSELLPLTPSTHIGADRRLPVSCRELLSLPQTAHFARCCRFSLPSTKYPMNTSGRKKSHPEPQRQGVWEMFL